MKRVMLGLLAVVALAGVALWLFVWSTAPVPGITEASSS